VLVKSGEAGKGREARSPEETLGGGHGVTAKNGITPIKNPEKTDRKDGKQRKKKKRSESGGTFDQKTGKSQREKKRSRGGSMEMERRRSR